MAETGKELGADLYRLDEVAKKCLPSVAAEYQVAKSNVDTSMTATGDAMRRSDYFGGSHGPVYGAGYCSPTP